jgi:O-methyltransferase involved in polyketide biosynthesis
MYLPADAVERIVAYAGGFPDGSRLILTYLPRAVAEDPRFARWRRMLNWQTAFHPEELAERLSGHGLTVLADMGAEEHRRRLEGRDLAVFEGERIVIAAKGG